VNQSDNFNSFLHETDAQVKLHRMRHRRHFSAGFRAFAASVGASLHKFRAVRHRFAFFGARFANIGAHAADLQVELRHSHHKIRARLATLNAVLK